MEHIHIALVGGQAYPIYLAIKALQPTKVVLMHSVQSETDANNIIKVLEEEGALMKEQFEKVCLSTAKMDDMVDKIVDQESIIPEGAHCSVNLTGGTKLWSVLLYKIFQNRSDTDFFYVDQNCMLYNIDNLQKYESEVQLDANTIFKLYGSPVKSYTRFEEYTKEDFDVIKRIESLRNFSVEAYNGVGNPMNRTDANKIRNQKTGFIQYQDSYAEWDKDANRVEVSLYGRKGIHKSDILESPHAVQLFFSCHWFELKVARILSKWKYAKQILLNVEFPYKNNNPKNEIDIVVNTGKRLLFVECKTQIEDMTNIDKFSKAVKNYSGMASKSLFISYVSGTKKSLLAQEKCEQNDVMCFGLEHHSESDLFKMLEQSLNELNKK